MMRFQSHGGTIFYQVSVNRPIKVMPVAVSGTGEKWQKHTEREREREADLIASYPIAFSSYFCSRTCHGQSSTEQKPRLCAEGGSLNLTARIASTYDLQMKMKINQSLLIYQLSLSRRYYRQLPFRDLFIYKIAMVFELTPDVRWSMKPSFRYDMHNDDERLKHQWIAHGCCRTGNALYNIYVAIDGTEKLPPCTPSLLHLQ